MRDDLFAIPLRKYHLDNNDDFLDYYNQIWEENKFDAPSPFFNSITQLPPTLTQCYADLIEGFLTDIRLYDTHGCAISGILLKCLEKGESTDRSDTLPSHYTAIHYVDVKDGDTSDIFHHPSRSAINAFRPAPIDEWKEAAGLYINSGDVIIFPSYMEHSSPMNRKSKNRVTVTLPLVLEENEQGRETNIKEPTS